MRLAPCDLRQVMVLQQMCVVLVLVFVVYDTLKVGYLMFLELWLITYPLSCGLGYGLTTWHSLSCGSE